MKNYFLTFIFCFVALSKVSAKRYYVNQNAEGNNSGLSWGNAFTTIQNALGVATSGDEIWVAAGTYYPTSSLDRDASFNMKNGVHVFGGFVGVESDISDRDQTSNFTILSGDIGVKNDNSDNSKTIMRFESINADIIFDGFRIDGGNNMADDNIEGGTAISLINNSAKIFLTNIMVSNCRAYRKSAVYIFNSRVNATSCLFSMNSSIMLAGAIYAGSNSDLSISNSQFERNSANLGAALDFQGKNLEMDRCDISRNTCSQGRIINVGQAVEDFVISNSLIVGNLAISANVLASSSVKQNAVKIINSTIAGNSASNSFASTIYKYPEASPMMIYNCIVWDNGNNLEVNQQNLVYNSIVKNGYSTGINVIDSDPLFKAPGSSSSAPFAASTYNYSLKNNSPAISAGNNTFVEGYEKDFLGHDRIVNGIVDLGAIEFEEILASDEAKTSNKFIYSRSNKSILILDKQLVNKTMAVFDMQGRKIIENKIASNIVKLNLSRGLYVVQIENKVIKINVD
ncbi:Por secretion system C-terminal sorting domain-containing protein [Epilithonimonas lactis]|nr:Por secretion system C-terminal sorting domain-containing protein [Epilithonimonas lactis]